ncbi:MAG TPA: hypothetical protein VFR24_12430 [Candidatus Angelobacter sp.]|nr:hypothetical protein [Candidatus Angelobacter sp.]
MVRKELSWMLVLQPDYVGMFPRGYKGRTHQRCAAREAPKLDDFQKHKSDIVNDNGKLHCER